MGAASFRGNPYSRGSIAPFLAKSLTQETLCVHLTLIFSVGNLFYPQKPVTRIGIYTGGLCNTQNLAIPALPYRASVSDA
jgi:hypothetical protein